MPTAAELAKRIRQVIKRRHLTQVAAAALMGIDQPKVSALLNGRLANFSSERLMRLLTALGEDVEITLAARNPNRDRGEIRVSRGEETTRRTVSPATVRFDDMRQARIHRRLGLVGEGPQAFYRDAVRLLGGPIVESTSHLVGHLLREIESALRDVLEPVTHYEGQIKKKAQGVHEQEVQIILRDLGIGEAEGPGALWLEIARRGLHGLAHRRSLDRPRPFDDQFRELWDEVESILDIVLERFESRFLDLHEEADRLLKKPTPSEADLKYLRDYLPNNPVTRFYFFGNLQYLGWLQPLADSGFFSDPPAATRDEAAGTIGFPQWPIATYLDRMAAYPAAQSGVVKILLTVPDTDNVSVHTALADVVLKLPASQATRLVDRIATWVSLSSFGLLPEKAGEIAMRLAAANRKAKAFSLLRSVLDPARIQKNPAATRESLEGYAYGQVLEKHLPEFVARWPTETLSLLCHLLDDAIKADEEDSLGYRDSYVWRRSIKAARPWRQHEILDMLVDAVRDTVVGIAGKDLGQVPRLLETLETWSPPIFRRIALYLLATFPQAAPEAVERHLRRRELFDGWTREQEYIQLLSAGFRQLSDETKTQILNWIDAGPNPEYFEGRTEDQIHAIKRNWQRLRLKALKGGLPEAWEARLQDLLVGEGEAPELDDDDEGGWIGPTAPRSPEQLKALAIEELVEFLHTWKPKPGWRESSPEGLGRSLTTVVSETPDRIAPQARLFRGLEPTYVRAVILGLKEALKQSRGFAWPQVLDLCDWVVSQPRVDERQRRDDERDPGWSWTRSAIASLIAAGVDSDSNQIPFDLRRKVWSVLEPITWDPDPDLSREAKDSGDDAFQVAINSVRGEAMIAVVRYAVWVEETSRAQASPQSGMKSMPEVARNLAEHLDVVREPSAAVRSVFGEAFPTLHWIDSAWAENHVAIIFPAEQENTLLRSAAWSTYLRFRMPYDALFPLLSHLYEEAVEALNPVEGKKADLDSVDSHLGMHVMSFYWRGVLGADALARRLFIRGGTAHRRAALEFIGRSLMNTEDDIPPLVIARLQSLWEWWFGEATKGPDVAPELETFGWWLASEQFPLKWALKQASRVLDIGRSLEPDHLVVKYLATLVQKRPFDSAQILHGLWENVSDQWTIYGWRKDARAVLDAVLKSGDPKAVQIAREIINKLAARGHSEFRDLLQAQ